MPAPKNPNTAAATRASTAAARRRGQETMAAKLRAAGWVVVPPEEAATSRAIPAHIDVVLHGEQSCSCGGPWPCLFR